MLKIDGSLGEGGGQIIRTSLALSLITGKAFQVERVRHNRTRPGLQPQHLTAVQAAARIGQAEVEGARVGASEFRFVPGDVVQGEYVFSTGTAGSTTLVLQTLLPPLMLADAPSVLTIEGGTHNTHAPPFDFLAKTFLPIINRMGAPVSIELQQYGFYPRGGGRLNVFIEPVARSLKSFELNERGTVRSVQARALIVNLSSHIAERELNVARERFSLHDGQLKIETSKDSYSAGNVFMIEVESEHLIELFSQVGERGVRAEEVAERVCAEAESYLESGAPVDEHLADQLLIPMALAGSGSFTTNVVSLHTTTNIEIIQKFLDVRFHVASQTDNLWRIEVSSS
jgi:RNA 3'-terminal phosphate cyclase (ATP)